MEYEIAEAFIVNGFLVLYDIYIVLLNSPLFRITELLDFVHYPEFSQFSPPIVL
jgi:hypothetical protein